MTLSTNSHVLNNFLIHLYQSLLPDFMVIFKPSHLIMIMIIKALCSSINETITPRGLWSRDFSHALLRRKGRAQGSQIFTPGPAVILSSALSHSVLLRLLFPMFMVISVTGTSEMDFERLNSDGFSSVQLRLIHVHMAFSPEQLPRYHTIGTLGPVQILLLSTKLLLCSSITRTLADSHSTPCQKRTDLQIKWDICICISGSAAKSNTMTILTKYCRHFPFSFSACHPLYLMQNGHARM